MSRHFGLTVALIFVAGMPLQLKATAQAPPGEVLTPNALRELEKSAKTASDHERLAAYDPLSGSAGADLTIGDASVGFGTTGTLAKISNKKWPRTYSLPYSGACQSRRYKSPWSQGTTPAKYHPWPGIVSLPTI